MTLRRLTDLACSLILLAAFASAAAMDITQVSDDLYVGGQPTASELAQFAGGGGRHVIDLRMPSENPGFDEAGAVAEAGMKYHRLPIAGPAGLTRDNVQALDRLLSQFQGEKTLLHCASSNRVGALMALRAKWLYGAGEAEALALGREHGLASLRPEVERLLKEE